jgi:hypothetical protein
MYIFTFLWATKTNLQVTIALGPRSLQDTTGDGATRGKLFEKLGVRKSILVIGNITHAELDG